MSKILKINFKKTTLLLLPWFSLSCAFLFPTQMQSLKLGPLFLIDTFTGKMAHGVNKHQLITFIFFFNSETGVQSQASWDNLFLLWDK